MALFYNPQDAQHHPGWQYYPTAKKRKDQSEEDYKKKLKQLEKILADQKEREQKYYEEKGNEVVIKVLTYNVAHEIGKSEHICYEDDKCLKNVCRFIQDEATDCDFIGIQEYSNIPKLQKYCQKLKSMSNSHEHYPDYIKKYGPITFYNQEKYKLDKDCYTMKFGFNKQLGRGIQINFFNNNLCVINVHAGHRTKDKNSKELKNDITTFDMSLEQFLESDISQKCKDEFILKLQTYNIIMFGDMNSDIRNFDHITIYGQKRKLYGRTLEPTCCLNVQTMDDYIQKTPYDHILSTFSEGNKKIVKGLKFHSDHNPVISTFIVK